MANSPKPGSRQSQARVDAAERGSEAKRKSLKRTVKDKSTGAMVFPLKDYKAYGKADDAFAKARIAHMTPAEKAKLKATGKKKK